MMHSQDLPRYPNGGRDSSEEDARYSALHPQNSRRGSLCGLQCVSWFSHIFISPGAVKVGAAHSHNSNGAAHVQHPASQVFAPSPHVNVISPLAEYDVEGSDLSGSEDSDAPFARADAAAAAAAAATSRCSPSTDAVPSADGAIADEERDEDEVDDEEEDEGDVESSYSDVDGDSDPEDSAIRCVPFPTHLQYALMTFLEMKSANVQTCWRERRCRLRLCAPS